MFFFTSNGFVTECSEYVAKIRSIDPKKCWPFGSLGDPNNNEVFTSYKSTESTFLSSQNCPSDINCSDDIPEHIEAPNCKQRTRFHYRTFLLSKTDVQSSFFDF